MEINKSQMRNGAWASFPETSWLNSVVMLLQRYKNICTVDDNQTLFGFILFAWMCVFVSARAKRILSQWWLNNATDTGSRSNKYWECPHPTWVLIMGWWYHYHNRKNLSERTQSPFSFAFLFLSWLNNGWENFTSLCGFERMPRTPPPQRDRGLVFTFCVRQYSREKVWLERLPLYLIKAGTTIQQRQSVSGSPEGGSAFRNQYFAVQTLYSVCVGSVSTSGNSLVIVIHSLVTSRLDYGSVLHMGWLSSLFWSFS